LSATNLTLGESISLLSAPGSHTQQRTVLSLWQNICWPPHRAPHLTPLSLSHKPPSLSSRGTAASLLWHRRESLPLSLITWHYCCSSPFPSLLASLVVYAPSSSLCVGARTPTMFGGGSEAGSRDNNPRSVVRAWLNGSGRVVMGTIMKLIGGSGAPLLSRCRLLPSSRC
jgi:hypothetical protein